MNRQQRSPGKDGLPFDYDGYVRAFNDGRHGEAIDAYYAEDAVADLMDGTHKGRAAIKTRLAAGDSAITEHMQARLVLFDGSSLFSDVEVEFTASKAYPDFWLGSMEAGEKRTLRMFALYQTHGGKITSVITMAKQD